MRRQAPCTAVPSEFRLTARDGIRLSLVSLVPPDPDAIVLIIHGMSEHKGRYLRLLDELSREGYAAYAYDQRGFGRSEGPRGDASSVETFPDDLLELSANASARHPGKRIVWIGHSFGGLVALGAALRAGADGGGKGVPDAIVLSAPPILVPPLEWRLRIAGFIAGRLFPRRPFRYRNEPAKLSHDPAVVEVFRNDPLVQNVATPRFYAAFRRLQRFVLKNAAGLKVPLLVIQGGADRIVVPEGARLLFDRVSGPKRLLWYSDFFHEPFNEIGREKVVAEMLGWLRETLAA